MRNKVKNTIAVLGIMAGLFTTSVIAHSSENDADKITKTFDLKDFDAIKVGGVFKVDVNVGEAYSVTMTGDPEHMDRVLASVKNGNLYLKLENYKNKKWKKRSQSDGVSAVITLPKLNALSVSGVASGDINGVEAGQFDMQVSGVAEVKIEGTCGNLDAQVSGVGELDASVLKCKSADISLSGVGEMSVYASETIDVSASGVGSVDVYGKPSKVSKSKSMFTEIKIK